MVFFFQINYRQTQELRILSYKDNLHYYPTRITIFSPYDHHNKALYFGKTQSNHIYSFKESIRCSQKIPLESRIDLWRLLSAFTMMIMR